MLVRDLMEREVVTLGAADTLDLADDIMRLARIRHLPVISGDRVVGILSQRDLFRAAVSSLLQLGRASEQQWLAKIPVAAVMSPVVFSISPGATVRQAVERMLQHKVGCLPVVEEGRLLGLVSETDCLRFLAHVLDISEQKGLLPEMWSG
jgi:CBS domain-containing protein